MAHKTLVDATAHKITGGRTLVNGTGYKIKSGKTMVGGTVYEVGFGPLMATITITGSGHEGNSYVTIDGTKYWSATTIEVPIGAIVECYVNSTSVGYKTAYVLVNGEKVAETTYNKNPLTYLYTVTCNATIDPKDIYFSFAGVTAYYGVITITET